MSDLVKFFEEFKKRDFSGVLVPPYLHSFEFRHSTVIDQPVLNFVVINCPASLQYFVSFYTDDYGESYCFLCVYDY